MAYEWKAVIDGQEYGMRDIHSAHIHAPMFDEFGAGNACCAELTLEFYPTVDPGLAAVIVPYFREVGTTTWKKLRTCWTYDRGKVRKRLRIRAVDAMHKADEPFLQTADVGEWPRSAIAVLNEIAERMGVALDPRNQITDFMLVFPNQCTMRDILMEIAAANAGNFIITDDDTLLLVPLFEIPEMPSLETRVLGDEQGRVILFGGVGIRV